MLAHYHTRLLQKLFTSINNYLPSPLQILQKCIASVIKIAIQGESQTADTVPEKSDIVILGV